MYATNRKVRQTIAAGTCTGCGYVTALRDESRRTRRTTCGGCGHRVALDYVTGEHNGARPCDDRCQYATREFCSCSCGGANHRAGYIAPPAKIPVWVRHRDAKRHAAKRTRATEKADRARVDRATLAADGRAALLAAHPFLSELLTDRYAGTGDRFHESMRAALDAGSMSPGMVAAVERMITRDRERDARRAAADAARAVAVAAGVSVREGRQAVRGVIVGVKEVADRYSYTERYITKITVACADGTRLFGTLPADIEPEWSPEIADAFVGWSDRIKGQRVTFVATVEPSDKDPLFGFFKRPAVPADAPRLSHTGPDGQGPDGALPTVAKQRPRKERPAPVALVEPVATVEPDTDAGLIAARRTVAADILNCAVGARRPGRATWSYRPGFDMAETHGPAGTVHVTVNADGTGYDVTLYRAGTRVDGLTGVDVADIALVAGDLYASGSAERARASAADVAAVAAVVRPAELRTADGTPITSDPRYCVHGRYVGTPTGPDYLCGDCEDGDPADPGSTAGRALAGELAARVAPVDVDPDADPWADVLADPWADVLDTA